MCNKSLNNIYNLWADINSLIYLLMDISYLKNNAQRLI